MAKILLLDDEPDLLQAMTRVLQAAGHTVVTFDNGRAGIAHLKTDPPDLLITDIFMPEMEGLETIKTVHRLRPDLPIIAISGGNFQRADYLTYAREFGAAATLRKPFRLAELVELVTKLLAPAAQ